MIDRCIGRICKTTCVLDVKHFQAPQSHELCSHYCTSDSRDNMLAGPFLVARGSVANLRYRQKACGKTSHLTQAYRWTHLWACLRSPQILLDSFKIQKRLLLFESKKSVEKHSAIYCLLHPGKCMVTTAHDGMGAGGHSSTINIDLWWFGT